VQRCEQRREARTDLRRVGVGYRTITAYNNCRLRHGGRAGHCNTPVLGFRCRDIRTSSPTQFVAKATCTKPRQSVVFTYSENT
jgi:hypothetical protein